MKTNGIFYAIVKDYTHKTDPTKNVWDVIDDSQLFVDKEQALERLIWIYERFFKNLSQSKWLEDKFIMTYGNLTVTYHITTMWLEE